MVGLALVTFVSVLGTGLLDTTEKGVERQVAAGLRRRPPPTAGTRSRRPSGAALAASPEAETVSSVRQDSALVEGSQQDVGGVNPATIGSVYRFDWAAGLGRGARHAGRRRRDRRAVVRR